LAVCAIPCGACDHVLPISGPRGRRTRPACSQALPRSIARPRRAAATATPAAACAGGSCTAVVGVGASCQPPRAHSIRARAASVPTAMPARGSAWPGPPSARAARRFRCASPAATATCSGCRRAGAERRRGRLHHSEPVKVRQLRGREVHPQSGDVQRIVKRRGPAHAPALTIVSVRWRLSSVVSKCEAPTAAQVLESTTSATRPCSRCAAGPIKLGQSLGGHHSRGLNGD